MEKVAIAELTLDRKSEDRDPFRRSVEGAWGTIPVGAPLPREVGEPQGRPSHMYHRPGS